SAANTPPRSARWTSCAGTAGAARSRWSSSAAARSTGWSSSPATSNCSTGTRRSSRCAASSPPRRSNRRPGCWPPTAASTASRSTTTRCAASSRTPRDSSEVRAHVRSLVDAAWFKRLIIILILLNGVTLGLETWPQVLAEHGRPLHALDRTLLWIFVAEIGLRLYAYRRDFFRDPWNLFDLVVIGIALLPATGPFSVLRVLRVLRLLRLLSAIPSLRMVVTGLFRALPGMASISLLLALLLYIAGVVATKLFQQSSPQYFGDLWTS